ncbi:sugar phosphate isomerase/epimerase [Phenylobacterium sp. J367]|uniref:sugar phosphate isomerase/epimerase family protein n=1 Tax=Phenylobacterium sp. J367 TaxID=2898435 RepID=UPI002150B1A1|nr:sugar phosphate isomerase/epimerase family protein [Phenylobacterium sp. J367]MCR5879295.1 sugar phosphate isomerase/epimerase [Phenylobacterium sp. J367]
MHTPRLTANTATFSGPLEPVVAAVKAAGFDGIEIWERDLDAYPGGAEAAGRLLQSAALGVSALQVLRDFEGAPEPKRAERRLAAEAMMERVARVGADTLLACANVQPDSLSDRTTVVRDLRELGDMAKARGLRIAFEPLAWSRWLNRYADAWACVQAVDHPALGLTLDCFHLFQPGDGPGFVDSLDLDKCFLVQLCDGRKMDLPPIEMARHHRLFPGEGDWPVRGAGAATAGPRLRRLLQCRSVQ